MVSKKTKQKLLKHHICSASRIIACAAFLILTIIGVSSLVKAMSLETIANENGIPSSWNLASLGNPDTITIPGTYWDQRQDDCNDPNRQFEWVMCGYWTKGAMQGLVKDTLGKDGLPIPAFTNTTDAWNNTLDVFSKNVIGNDPVQPTDNFYRWFHETDKSKAYEGEAIFTRTGKNTYTYGREGIFPLDNISDFSKDDEATKQYGHNYHFTSHLSIPMKISADGTEHFEFSGDDDVWVFLNGKLVLDIGGLHEKLTGWFTINQDGTVSTYVQHVNDPSVRTVLGEPSSDFNSYVNPLNELIMKTYQDKYDTIDVGLKEGDVVNLDFFYAERSTTESNTKITISNMNWPISADSTLDGKIVGRIENTNSNLVEFQASIKNRDPARPLDLERLAAYIREDTAETGTVDGFLPLDVQTLYYTTTPDDNDSWQPVDISAPSSEQTGFNLTKSIRMSPSGQAGDTLYFRYFAETAEYSGNMTSKVSFYTTLNGNSGVTYDYDTVTYTAPEKPAPHKVTVKYQYEDGSEASPDVTEEHPSGEEFSIDSPDITNYTPDIKTVFGTMGDQDQTYIVIYKPNPPEPTKPTVTIHYVYEDGSPAADDYIEELEPGTPFNIPSPEIENHTPDQPNVSDTIGDKNLEYFVHYKPNQPTEPDPIIPDEPKDDPSTEQPETPVIPTIPSSPIFGDASMAYLAPLGEVAFVPNTGIVSTALASIFEQGFAEVILSQWFVMVVLLIFAISFAAYFSMRKYLNPKATATRSSVHNSPKNAHKSARITKNNPKNPKSAKMTKQNNARRTAASAKTTTKSTRKKS